MENVHIPGTLSCNAAGHENGLNYRTPILQGEGPESGELEGLYGVYRVGGSGVGVGGLRDTLLVQLGLQVG